jgi:phosphatidylserine/phosphatidylglycerophosphate/cardiolipin synthase-like enzyme
VIGHFVADLHVSIGAQARVALCDAFAAARSSIRAQFHSLGDPDVVGALNAAAARGVDVSLHLEGDVGRYDRKRGKQPRDDPGRVSFARYSRMLDARIHIVVEDDPLVLEHSKAAVVDDRRAFISTANPNRAGFGEPGDFLVEDDEQADVAAVSSAIVDGDVQTRRIVDGPDPGQRARIAALLDSPVDERIAIEGLSDPLIIDALEVRAARGLHDEVLVKCERKTRMDCIRDLTGSGVAVRTLPGAYLHAKYIDAGDRLYIGSANLTRNGLDEAREVGIIASPDDFDDGAAAMRTEFDRMWSAAIPIPVISEPLRPTVRSARSMLH